MEAKVVLISSSAKINLNLLPFSGIPGKVAEMTDVKKVLPIIMWWKAYFFLKTSLMFQDCFSTES